MLYFRDNKINYNVNDYIWQNLEYETLLERERWYGQGKVLCDGSFLAEEGSYVSLRE